MTAARSQFGSNGKLTGYDKLTNVLDSGRGVIVGTAHYGNPEIAVQVAEVVFLGESLTCHVVTPGGCHLTLKAMGSGLQPLQPGAQAKVRWAASEACLYDSWNESDLSKGAGAH